eukprot:359731-Chlamydomonas_euryale.AAC.2
MSTASPTSASIPYILRPYFYCLPNFSFHSIHPPSILLLPPQPLLPFHTSCISQAVVTSAWQGTAAAAGPGGRAGRGRGRPSAARELGILERLGAYAQVWKGEQSTHAQYGSAQVAHTGTLTWSNWPARPHCPK